MKAGFISASALLAFAAASALGGCGKATGDADPNPSSTAGSSGSTDVCAGQPAGCIEICEGGSCTCYCEASGGTAGVDCDCQLGAYRPVCGVDGTTYDATCGIECVPVQVACEGECPCPDSDCTDDCAAEGLLCCAGRCVNAQNDPTHCGSCESTCSGDTPYCNLGTCQAPPCDDTANCSDASECCGTECCSSGQMCCLIMDGPWYTQCADPVDGTCPVGCPLCVCAAPDTPIATPKGERSIADLAVGDLVYSVVDQAVVPVPVLETNRVPVSKHEVVQVRLATGRVLEISAPHPTADGRTFGQLRAGDQLDGVVISSVTALAYEHPFTYDILPDSPNGTYFAAGVEIGSTLRSDSSRRAR